LKFTILIGADKAFIGGAGLANALFKGHRAMLALRHIKDCSAGYKAVSDRFHSFSK
jgi:hypothetical protein